MNQEAGAKPSSPSEPPRRPGPPRRRGGRGRRRPEPRNPSAATGESASIPGEQPVVVPVAEPPNREPQHRSPSAAQPQQSRTGSPITQATAQVEEVIKSLKQTLRELEEVLEILDDAQRQQIGDEKEIESLRRSLSVLQRERQSAPREESRGRSENRGGLEYRSRSEEQRPPVKTSPIRSAESEE